MKRLLTALAMLALLLGGASSARDSAQAESKQALRNLFQVGIKAAQEKLEEKKPAEPAAAESPPPSPLSLFVQDTIGQALGATKGSLKTESGSFAAQLGDLIADRLLSDPRVQEALLAVKALAWALVAYLSLVSLSLLGGLRSLKKSSRSILQLLRERKRGAH